MFVQKDNINAECNSDPKRDAHFENVVSVSKSGASVRHKHLSSKPRKRSHKSTHPKISHALDT